MCTLCLHAPSKTATLSWFWQSFQEVFSSQHIIWYILNTYSILSFCILGVKVVSPKYVTYVMYMCVYVCNCTVRYTNRTYNHFWQSKHHSSMHFLFKSCHYLHISNNIYSVHSYQYTLLYAQLSDSCSLRVRLCVCLWIKQQFSIEQLCAKQLFCIALHSMIQLELSPLPTWLNFVFCLPLTLRMRRRFKSYFNSYIY